MRTKKPINEEEAAEDKKLQTAFGQRLSFMRQKLGMSQAELAEKVNMSPASIISYEKAQKAPSITTAYRISKALGVSLDWLSGLTDNESLGDIDTFDEAIKMFARLILSGVLVADKECFIFPFPFGPFGHQCANMTTLYQDEKIDKELLTLWFKKEAEKHTNKSISVELNKSPMAVYASNALLQLGQTIEKSFKGGIPLDGNDSKKE